MSGSTWRFRIARPGGQITKVGWSPEEIVIDMNPLVLRNLRVQGSFSHNFPVWERVIHLLDGVLDAPDAIVGLRSPLTGWRDAFDAMHERRVIKSVLVPDGDYDPARMPSLAQKVALVTGSTSGIGRGIAEHFASLGARVVVHGLDEQGAADVLTGLRAAGGRRRRSWPRCRGRRRVPAMMHAAIAWKGGIDILVNNAGDRAWQLEDATVELWDRIMRVNLRAPFICLQEAARVMKTRGGGSILNIGSVNAYIGETKLGPYSVSKGGLMTLTRNAASTLGRHKIRVNQINVGWTLTEGEDAVQKKQGTHADWLADAVRVMPFGRLLTPREIAGAAAYFASDESALVTGGVLDMEQMPIGAPADW